MSKDCDYGENKSIHRRQSGMLDWRRELEHEDYKNNEISSQTYICGNKVACSVISRVGQLMDVLRRRENIQKIHCKNGIQESCVELIIS